MKTKSVVKDLVKVIRTHKLTYQDTCNFMSMARKECGLVKPTTQGKVKELPTINELKTFLNIVDESNNIQDKLMMKILLYMGLRANELCNLLIKDIDLRSGCEKVYVRRKGGRDRYFVIPGPLVDLIRFQIQTHKNQVFLFESKYRKQYDSSSIRKKFIKYRNQAGLSNKFHAHAFRAVLITYLSGEGWTSRQIKLVSGHVSTNSVDTYDKTNSEKIRGILNQSIRKLEGEIYG